MDEEVRPQFQIDGTGFELDRLFKYSFEIEDFSYLLMALNVKFDSIKLAYAYGKEPVEIPINKSVTFQSDLFYQKRKDFVDVFCVELKNFGEDDFSKKDVLETIQKKIKGISYEQLTQKHLLDVLFQKTSGFLVAGGQSIEESIKKVIEGMKKDGQPPKNLKTAIEKTLKLNYDEKLEERKQTVKELESAVRLIRDISSLVNTAHEQIRMKEMNIGKRVDNFGAKLAELIKKAFEKEVMGGLTYEEKKSYEKEDVQEQNPIYSYIISNPVEQLIEKRNIKKRYTAEGPDEELKKTYLYIPGIDELVLEDLAKGFEKIRDSINKSNKELYQEHEDIKRDIDEFEAKKNEGGLKGAWFNLRYKLSRKLKEKEKTLNKKKSDWKKKVACLKRTPDGKIAEAEDGNFYLGKAALTAYKTLIEDAGKFRVSTLFSENAEFNALFGEYKNDMDESMKYHTSRLERIVSFHLSEKGIIGKSGEELKKPEDLEFHRPYGNEIIDYVVRQNGKKELLICENYGDQPVVGDDETPKTIYSIQEKRIIVPDKKGRFRRATYPVVLLAAAAGILSAFSFYNLWKARSLEAEYYAAESSQKDTKIDTLEERRSDLETQVYELKKSESRIIDSLRRERAKVGALKNEIESAESHPEAAKKDNSDLVKELNSIFYNYNENNRRRAASIYKSTGIAPSSADILGAYRGTGNTKLLADFRESLEIEGIYNAYLGLIRRGQFGRAKKLHENVGQIRISNKMLISLIQDHIDNDSFCRNILVNHMRGGDFFKRNRFEDDYADAINQKITKNYKYRIRR